MSNHDYYHVLGLSLDVSDDEIRKAYRRIALECHPDHHPADPHSEERFKLVSEAYSVLGDAGKRREYDLRYRRAGDRGNVFVQTDPDALFRNVRAWVSRPLWPGRTGDKRRWLGLRRLAYPIGGSARGQKRDRHEYQVGKIKDLQLQGTPRRRVRHSIQTGTRQKQRGVCFFKDKHSRNWRRGNRRPDKEDHGRR